MKLFLTVAKKVYYEPLMGSPIL